MSAPDNIHESSRYNILTAEIEHETNTFCVLPTTLDNFRRYQYIDNPQDIKLQRQGTKTSLGAAFEAAELFAWNITASLCAVANPTGKVTDETFEHLCCKLLEPCHTQKFDGILLNLHGAMVTGICWRYGFMIMAES